MIPYDPGYLAGWTVERYQIDLVNAAGRSREIMEGKIEQLCAAAVPGDTQRNLDVQSTFSDQKFKHILVPVWLLTYTYGARVFQVLVNGYTGKMEGTYPKSPWKVLLAVTLVLLVVLLILYSQAH